VELYYIDYIQLLNLPDGKIYSRQEEIKQICIALKDGSREGLPIILGLNLINVLTEYTLLK
jgi:hypothetical protein